MKNMKLEALPEDVERSRRNRTFKKATILFKNQTMSRDCILKNVSDTGALLEFKSIENIPLVFELRVELDGYKVECKTVRKTGNKLAVNFINAPETIKVVRKQVVNASNPNLEILMARERELKQIIANMRRKEPVKNEKPDYLNLPRSKPKFGKLK